MSKIIVVDDDITNVRLIKMLLELDGFSVTACTEVNQAITAAADGVQAFVIDCNLSRGTSGLDLLRDIRAGETTAPTDTIVIMTSGDYRRDEESRDAGADQFLLKPYPPQGLSQELSKLLNQRGQNGE